MSHGKTALKIFFIILAVLALAFLTQVGIYIYKIKTGKITDASFEEKFTSSKNTAVLPAILDIAEITGINAPSYGATKPELTIVEFGNFACPYSQEVNGVAREMMLKYQDKVKFIYRDFPLEDIYPGSSYLSLAGKCANAQNKFWPMHDKIYFSPKSDPQIFATQVGLNEKSFSDCLLKQKFGADIQKDFDDGYKNGVIGTPTFFFIKNNAPLKMQGAIPRTTFQQIIEDLLK